MVILLEVVFNIKVGFTLFLKGVPLGRDLTLKLGGTEGAHY